MAATIAVKAVEGGTLVGHFNQLIDQAMAFQADPQLWVPNPPPASEAHMLTLIEAIHIVGIGDLTNLKAAHWGLEQVGTELEPRADFQVLPLDEFVPGWDAPRELVMTPKAIREREREAVKKAGLFTGRVLVMTPTAMNDRQTWAAKRAGLNVAKYAIRGVTVL